MTFRHVTVWSGPVPRPSIGETPMTGAERQTRYRAAHANGTPVIRIRRPADRRSRIQRWNDTIAALVNLQEEYSHWLDALPDNQQDSATAEALRAMVEFDISDLLAIEPPRGFGRD
jgi:hypothetical protein